MDVDGDGGKVLYSSAGFPTQVYFTADNEVRKLHQTGPMIGVSSGSGYEMVEMTAQKGGRLLLFTDGFLSHLDAGNNADWKRYVVKMIMENQKKPIQEVVETFSQQVEKDTAHQKGTRGKDDITIVGL